MGFGTTLWKMYWNIILIMSLMETIDPAEPSPLINHCQKTLWLKIFVEVSSASEADI